MPDCFYFALCSRLAGRSATYEKGSFSGIFSSLGLFSQVFMQVRDWLILELHEMIRVPHIVTFPILFILFYDWDWQRNVKLYEKWSFFSVVSHLNLFPLVFGQVKWWLMLELYETIRVSHVVLCPFVFILFYDQDWQGGVLRLTKEAQF